MKSAAFSGNTGALQRCGNVASARHASSCALACERDHASSARSAKCSGADAVDQFARRSLAHLRRHAPPAIRHRGEPFVLGVGQSQALPQPLGIFGEPHGKRTEPPRRVRRRAASPLPPSPCWRSSRAAARRRAPSRAALPPPSRRARPPHAERAAASSSPCARARARAVPVRRAPRSRHAARPRPAGLRRNTRGSGRSAGCAGSPRRCASRHRR